MSRTIWQSTSNSTGQDLVGALCALDESIAALRASRLAVADKIAAAYRHIVVHSETATTASVGSVSSRRRRFEETIELLKVELAWMIETAAELRALSEEATNLAIQVDTNKPDKPLDLLRATVLSGADQRVAIFSAIFPPSN